VFDFYKKSKNYPQPRFYLHLFNVDILWIT